MTAISIDTRTCDYQAALHYMQAALGLDTEYHPMPCYDDLADAIAGTLSRIRIDDVIEYAIVYKTSAHLHDDIMQALQSYAWTDLVEDAWYAFSLYESPATPAAWYSILHYMTGDAHHAYRSCSIRVQTYMDGFARRYELTVVEAVERAYRDAMTYGYEVGTARPRI